MKKILTLGLCVAMLASTVSIGFAEDSYAELTPNPQSAVVIKDGYIENVEKDSTVAGLVANFLDRKNITVYDKNGNVMKDTDAIGSDFTVSYMDKSSALTYVYGDVNGDANVNAKDISAMLKLQAGFEVSACEKAGDVNHDDKTNSKDVSTLLKYSAGENISIYKEYDGEKAEFDDGSIDYRLDSVMNRIGKSNTNLDSNRLYTARMAKNEVETVQIYLTSEEDKTNMTFDVSPLTNANGAELEYEFLYGYYYESGMFKQLKGAVITDDNVDYDYYVEPMPELGKNEKFNLEANTSKAFYMRATTTAESEAGLYKATATLRDAEGKAVKVIELRFYVWDFTLDETPASATAFDLSYYTIASSLIRKYDGAANLTDEMVEKMKVEWYEYLLKNHISAYSLPYDVLDKRADKYMSDPRVTSFCVDGGGQYQGENQVEASKLVAIRNKLRTNDEWFKKGYVYCLDEPYSLGGVQKAKYQYDWLTEILGDDLLHICIPLGSNQYFKDCGDGTPVDSAEYMARYSDILCPQSYFFTTYYTLAEFKQDRSLRPKGYTVAADNHIIDLYGQFQPRYEQWREDGKTMWWYVCIGPQIPYANISFKAYQGIGCRMLMWQQYLYHSDGLLYWSTTDWQTVSKRKFSGNGDGVLLFDGSLFGKDVTPVSSIRLEYTRDGLEDFQYLAQLEKLTGSRDKSLEYVNELTTYILDFTEDYKEMEANRANLGFYLETLYNK